MSSREKNTPSASLEKASAVQDNVFHFKRSRLNNLFMEAMKYPIIMICAGAGYGKTTAVHDFVQEYKTTTVWVQLSDRDNVSGRFWENFCHSVSQINESLAVSLKKLGFPDSTEKIKQYFYLMEKHIIKERQIFVFDDCHCIENQTIIRFVGEAIRKLPPGTTLFVISRSTPHINLADLVSGNQLFEASEDILRFTEPELAQYFREQDICLQPDTLQKIMQDTEGWAFALNYIARSYKKAPGYEGYLRNAMKTNIFRFMDIEIWDTISKRLQNFLVRLSLVDHLSLDLLVLLAGGEKDLIQEMEKQNAYVRRDSYINAYLIHPLFLEFLATKQDLLSQEQKNQTYTIAGEWCKKNGFQVDALSYYEKTGDYRSITYMFIGTRSQIPYDIACYLAEICERAPKEIYDTMDYFASTHMRAYMCQGNWEEAVRLAQYYEAKYINLPKDNLFRMRTLSSVYYCWGISLCSMCLTKDEYNFDLCFEKQANCYSARVDPGNMLIMTPGPWANAVGSSRKGSVQEYIDAYARMHEHLSKCFFNSDRGSVDLANAEYHFYMGNTSACESFLSRAADKAREKKHSGVLHRALFYTVRIAFFQGNLAKARQALKEIKTLLDDTDYFTRFIDNDITLCWYYCVMGMPEKTPDWLKENFTLYGDAVFTESYANHHRALYFYYTRNYAPLLSYINEVKHRESFLFGRIEMLMLETCVHYKMKNSEKAYASFEEAYNTASPNELLMPFIEMGKDMRTLTAFVKRRTDCKIPVSWLESINRKSASYAKHLGHIVTEYKRASGSPQRIAISPREKEILSDLSHGLSRTEIAASRGISINTVKMVINNIYIKLGAENMADAIRIAAERKIV